MVGPVLMVDKNWLMLRQVDQNRGLVNKPVITEG